MIATDMGTVGDVVNGTDGHGPTQGAGPSRRQALRAVGGGAALLWAAPSILSMPPVAAAAGSASGPIVGGDGVVGDLVAGDSLRPESVAYSSNDHFFVLAENALVLDEPQITDSGDTLPAGVPLQAYLIHFSPAWGRGIRVSGTVDFARPIAGWDSSDAGLLRGDPTWAVPGVFYGTTRRTLERKDVLVIDRSAGFVDVARLRAMSTYIDQTRVFVQI